jgi:hypothetical protein
VRVCPAVELYDGRLVGGNLDSRRRPFVAVQMDSSERPAGAAGPLLQCRRVVGRAGRRYARRRVRARGGRRGGAHQQRRVGLAGADGQAGADRERAANVKVVVVVLLFRLSGRAGFRYQLQFESAAAFRRLAVASGRAGAAVRRARPLEIRRWNDAAAVGQVPQLEFAPPARGDQQTQIDQQQDDRGGQQAEQDRVDHANLVHVHRPELLGGLLGNHGRLLEPDDGHQHVVDVLEATAVLWFVRAVGWFSV